MVWRGIFFLVIFFGFGRPFLAASDLPKRDSVLRKAGELLENWQISYVYGGHKLGKGEDCQACNICLGAKQPKPEQRLTACPVCTHCSLDCSHYIFQVFRQAGLAAKYITTAVMDGESPEVLARDYHLLDIGRDLTRAMAGDLLVYEGHVVMLEKRGKDLRGDVIHVTSG